MEISLTKILSAIMVIGLRVSGLMLFAPFFASGSIPPRIKIVLVLAITAVLYPVFGPQLASVAVAHWPTVVASETLLGIAMGLATTRYSRPYKSVGKC